MLKRGAIAFSAFLFFLQSAAEWVSGSRLCFRWEIYLTSTFIISAT